MSGEGPFLWLSKSGPPSGFWHLPPGGMCVCAFLFVRKDGEILLGKYADDPKLEELTGLDARRRQVHGKGLTIPATHLKFGEDPRDAARRVGDDVLLLPGLRYSEPRVEVDMYPSRDFPGNMHSDLWFLVDATPPEGLDLRVPPWYAELGWHDPTTVSPEAYSRSHQDVVARWRQPRPV